MTAKKNTNGIKKTPFILGVAFIALGCTLGISSFAWFYLPQSTRQVEGMDGEATGSYFSIVNQETKIADGTSKNPYGIKTAKQLYYFNWLQDLGYFNKDENGDGVIDQQYYFVLMDDIDASKYVLPPAGTKEYPFVGNFEGNGYTISNLKISNSWGNLTDKPKGAKQDANNDALLSSAEIVGFFGIVGQYSSGESTTADSVTTGSVNCKAKDGSAKTATYTIRSVSGTGDSATTTYVNAVNNLYFDGLEVSTVADKTFAGLLAGYVNGQMQYCGVRSGNFNFGTNVEVLTDSVLGRSNDKLSKYSIVGDYNSNNFNWDGGKTDETTGNDWGSSIDMMNLTQRVNYIQAVTNQASTSNTVFYSDIYHFYAKSTATERKWDTVQTNYYHMFSGTYLPLSIDTEQAFTGEITNKAGNGNTFHTTQYYVDNNSSEKNGEYNIIASNNAGYLVGGGSLTDTGGMNDNIAIGRGYVTLRFQNVYNWLQNSFDKASSSTTYDGTTAKVYSVDTRNGSTSAQVNSSNYSTDFGYSKFETVKSNFDSNHNGKTTMYGFHFYPMTESNSDFKSEMVKVKIFGKEYSEYQFLKGTLNFTTKSKGIITTLLASSYSNYDAMFDLFKLERDSANKITSINRIKQIYQNSKGDYVYVMDGSDNVDTSGMTLLFDFDQVTGESNYLKNTKSLYYFEIPVNPGDYAIGKSINTVKINSTTYKEEKGAGANILYLDIGANNGDTTPTPTTTTIPPIDFVYYSDPANKVIKKINSTDSEGKADYVPSKLTCAVAGKPTTVYFYRVLSSDGTTESIVLYYVNSAGDNATLTWTGTGTREEETIDGYTTSN